MSLFAVRCYKSDTGQNCLLSDPVLFYEYMSTLRTKNNKGQFVAKRFDTKISTIEKQYGVDLGVKGNMKLGNYLKKQGYPSLSKMLKTK